MNAAEIEKTFDKMADLARLGPFEPEQKEKLAGDFKRILDLFQVFSEIAPEPSIQEGLGALGSARKDESRSFAARDRIIANFPDKEGGLLKVPKVIE